MFAHPATAGTNGQMPEEPASRQEESFFDSLFEDPASALQSDPDAADALSSAPSLIRSRVFSPLINPGSVAAAIVDRRGDILAATSAFEARAAERYLAGEAIRQALGARTTVAEPVFFGREGVGEPATFIYSPAEAAGAFLELFPDLASKVEPDSVVVLTSLTAGEGLLEWAGARFGLTGLQRRVVAATIRTGSIKRAAVTLGIAHHTAREALSQSYRLTGAARLPQLVARLASLAIGLLPSDLSAGPLLVDIWGLSERQAAIALTLADGVAREECARILALSPAVVRKELEHIFGILQVTTESELIRTLTGLRGLSALLGAERGLLGAVAEPLRLTPRNDGTLIAWSDYGPPGGRPVLFVHSSMSTRIAPRVLVSALQRAGYRPISVDRPGFGMTDPRAGLRAGAHDPFEAAADDMILLAKAIGLERFDVVARGGAQFVLALSRRDPGCLGRVVLVNPDPPTGADRRRVGPIGYLKEMYQRRPELIRPMAHLLARSLTRERVRTMFARSVQGSRADEGALADDAVFDDYHRSVRMIATGRLEGYVNEQVALATAAPPAAAHGGAGWTVLIGDTDTLHDPAVVEAYWRGLLPGGRFVHVDDAGRFLAMTHPALVVQALAAPP